MSLRGLAAAITRQREIRLPAHVVEDVIRRHDAHPWFVYAFRDRSSRWHAWESCFWLARRLRASARILDSGCGCALDLIWLGQNGFANLTGIDIDPKAIAAGRDLCAAAGVPAVLWIDDGLAPSRLPPEPLDAVLAVNWTYHLEGFRLETFLQFYRARLSPHGTVVIDVIDASFDGVPNNEFLTSDWGRPVEQRRPSEYHVRYSEQQVRRTAEAAGFRVRSRIGRADVVPRRVYALQRRD